MRGCTRGNDKVEWRSFHKRETRRYFRRHKLDPDFDYSGVIKISNCGGQVLSYGWSRSHNTKPLYKQINRETIRKWGDAA